MSSLSKNAYREILRSPGRFLAILAIIVLGSGFFVGLRVSQKAMKATADTYFSKTGFFDLSVSTTLGLDRSDVETFLADPGVLDAEGSFETDALVNLGGETDLVYAFYSLPERINTPDLLEGRLPQAPDECLADSWTGLSVGDRVYISESNESATLDLFTVRELTVTGIATSPLYLNFERGSTSLGAGSVSAFCYVPWGTLDVDYFTTVYLRLPDMPEAYSDEYNERVEAVEQHFTDLAKERAEARRESVISDAEAELRDGWAEYDDACAEYEARRADAEVELADALRKLEDARAELEDARRQLEDGKKKLADGKKELDDNELTLINAKMELNKARAELDNAERQLADGWAEYNAAAAELEAQRADARRQIEDAEAELNEALGALEEAEAQYSENFDIYNKGKSEYDRNAAELEESRSVLEKGESDYERGMGEYRLGLSQYSDSLDKLGTVKSELDGSKAELDARQVQFDGLMGTLLTEVDRQLTAGGLPPYGSSDRLLTAIENGDPIAVNAVNSALQAAGQSAGLPADSEALLAVRNELVAGAEKYNSALAEYEAELSKLRSVKDGLDSTEAALLSSRRELDQGWAQLEEGQKVLDASRLKLDEAKSRLDAGRAELDAGRREYDAGLAELESSRREFDSAIADAEKELSGAKAELEEAQRQHDEGLAEYEAGLAVYNDGMEMFKEAKAEFDRSEAELADAQREYSDGLAEYEDGLAEYNSSRAEADREFADAEAELADAREELEDAHRKIDDMELPEVFLLGRWSNLGYVCFENDSSIVRSISSVFPVFFFLVAALICITTVSRMVEEQRSQLGVLMALGYSRPAVMGKFLVYSGTATVIGCVSGILLGSKMIPLVVWQAYRIMYSFSDNIEFYFDLPLSAVTFALYLAAMMAVTWLSCRREINDVPANVIRPKPPKAGKRVILERVPFIWNRLGFLWKVTVRNIFRYKLRVLMMILGVAGCTALMLTGMGINDSIKNVVDYQFTEISLYDYTVTFSDELTLAERDKFLTGASAFAEDTLFVHQSSVTASAGRNEKEVQLSAVDAEHIGAVPDFVDFHNGSKKLAFPGKGEALINSGLAKSLGIGAGDRLTIRYDDGPSMELTVSGVYDNYIYNTIYVSSETLSGENGANYALILKKAGADAGETMAAILGMDNVLTATSSLDLRNRIGNMMESLIYIVLLTIICAAALAFVVIYNLTNINIQERLREIATVKVLGFHNFESALYVLRENLLLTLLGAAAGIPMGLALNAFVVGQIELDMIRFTARVAPMSYLASIALTILFSLLVDLFMVRRLNTIDPASALKAAE